ncbi:MAG: metallophosphoesterase [Lachnospiraceae bacterium]|nr:metallophosphoesterase [Lachnospiraceae bacterium]
MESRNSTLKFLVFGDLHYDEAADSDKRIEEILANAGSRDLDFMVSLGDLCNPVQGNNKVLERFKSLGIPFYSVMGNHETDNCTLDEILDFYSLSNPYYSVIFGEYKLIFLNTCYLRSAGKEEIFYKRNFKSELATYPIVPAEEIRWLQEELKEDKKYIIFSHHSFMNDFPNRGVNNREEIRKLFAGRQILLCLNGHDHGDSYSFADGIPYMTVNSANYAWLGSQIASSRELMDKYSYLHGMVQYKQAMSAYVEIDDTEIKITGMDTEYLSVTPDDLGLHDYMWNGVSIRPQISSHLIKL